MPIYEAEQHCLLFKFIPRPTAILLKGIILIIILSIISVSARSQNFPVSAIPDSLKENADMIIRLNELSYEISSAGMAISRERHVYTILNEKGAYYATYKTHYNNKSVVINSVSGYLYDANGKELRHFKKKDMEDHPLYDESFVNDERLKVAEFSFNTYPYTVEFDEEDQLTELFQIGGWYPQGNLRHAVEKSVYSISAPSGYSLRYRMLNSSLQPVISEKGNVKTYSWEFKNMVAYDETPVSNILNCAPHLMIGLSDVEMGVYKGNMSTWTDYAKFYGSLQKGRDILPEETKQKVHALTDGLTDKAAKVDVLYRYLQQNSHYVGIQLGIGGWQTYDAAYVSKNKYGDCKALSNFMVSLLKEAGVKANVVVIRGGEERVDFVTDFTHDPFNHVICCVPLEKDTIWLECTDQFLPPGYLSDFTSNRYGLLIEEDGGKLVHTPSYLLPDNIRIRKIAAGLDLDGNLNLDSRTLYKAACQDDIESMIRHNSKEEQLKILKSRYNLPTYDVLSFEYQEDDSKRLPVINESIKISVKDYAQVTGKRIFINPNILSRSGTKLIEDKSRRLDVELKEEYHYIDSIQISIPPGYEMESKSTDFTLKSKYGSYMNRMIVAGDKIMYYRNMEQYSGRFPAKEYAEVVKFYDEMYDADHTKIVLVKKN
jgi:hypothetical protein